MFSRLLWVRVRTYMHAGIRTWFNARIKSCIHAWMQTHEYACTCIHIHTCIYTCIHIHKNTYTRIYKYIYAYAYIYTDICMHACIHTHTVTHDQQWKHSEKPWRELETFCAGEGRWQTDSMNDYTCTHGLHAYKYNTYNTQIRWPYTSANMYVHTWEQSCKTTACKNNGACCFWRRGSVLEALLLIKGATAVTCTHIHPWLKQM